MFGIIGKVHWKKKDSFKFEENVNEKVKRREWKSFQWIQEYTCDGCQPTVSNSLYDNHLFRVIKWAHTVHYENSF